MFLRWTRKKQEKYKIRFQVGDRVRIYKWRGAFFKSYTGNFTKEIFKINKVQDTIPPTYILEDENFEIIRGAFYSEELLLTKVSSYECLNMFFFIFF